MFIFSVSWTWVVVSFLLACVLLLTFTVFTVQDGVLISSFLLPEVTVKNEKYQHHKQFIEEIIFAKYPVLPEIVQRYEIESRQGIVDEFVSHAETRDQNALLVSEEFEEIDRLSQIGSFTSITENNISWQKETAPMLTKIEDENGQEKMLLTHAMVEKIASVPSDFQWKRKPDKGTTGLISELVELIIYINEPEHQHQKVHIEQEIKKVFQRDDRIDTVCVNAEKRENGSLGKLLSHITALSIACEQKRTVMIVEDDFEFYKSRDEIQNHLKLVQNSFQDRWNVIVLGQYSYDWSFVAETVVSNNNDETNIKLMRLLQCSSTCGYIVNRTYLPVLLNIWIEHMYNSFQVVDHHANSHQHLNQVQNRLQGQDIWLGFESPLGGSKKHVINNDTPLSSSDTWTVQDIGVYIKTSVHTEKLLQELLRHIYLETHKGHRLHVAVHHQPNQKFVNRHRRSYSATFYSGVKYFSSEKQIQEYLKPFDTVRWIDLEKWSQKDDDLKKLFYLVEKNVQNEVHSMLTGKSVREKLLNNSGDVTDSDSDISSDSNLFSFDAPDLENNIGLIPEIY